VGVYGGIEPTWASQTNTGRTHIATKGVVQSGLVLNLDAGVSSSYPGSGTTWTDLSGNGNTGTLTNGPTYSSANGGSIVFDGSNDYVNFGNILNIGTGQFSLEYFGKASTMTTNYAKISSKGQYLLSGSWLISHSKTPDNNYSVSFELGDGVSFGTGILVDTVYHVCFTRNDSNNIQLYLNGELKNSLVSTYNFTNSTNYSIGRSGFGEYWKGNMFSYRHYNRALTSTEIAQNFNATRARFGI
jgi:hypothetical protein